MMAPERLRQIEELYHAVRERGPSERVELLAQADPELRREVESLLEQAGSGLLDRPACDGAANLLSDPTRTRLSAGTQLGPYRIEAPLGMGGMGQVYRAQDTRLGRAVAPTDGEKSFAAATAEAITASMSSTAGQLLGVATQFFGLFAPSVTTDSEGKPKITFGFSVSGQPGPEIEEVLAAPAKIAARGKRKVVIVFDEFQQVLEYESDMVERRLRSVVQKHRDVSYIFLGSRKHLLQKMFLDRSRPLYRAAGHYPLGSIETRHWIPFIGKKFREGEKPFADNEIRRVCELTEGHPFYTQHLCHALWEICPPGEPVTEALIQDALKVLLDRESYAYTVLWESLASNQKRLLKGIASEPARAKLFAGPFITRHGLGSASNAQRAVESLLNRDLIDRDNGSYLITDRFFRIWIGQKQMQ